MAQTVFPRPNDASKVNVSDFYASNLPMSTTDSTTAGSKIGTLEGKLYTVLTSGSLKTFANNTSEGFTCFRYNHSVTDTPCQYGHGYVVHYGQNIRIVVFDMLTINEYSIYSQNTGSSWSSWEELALNSNIQTVALTGNTTLAVLKTNLLNTANAAGTTPVRIKFYSALTDSGFVNGQRYYGTLCGQEFSDGSVTHFTVLFNSDKGETVSVGYDSGTWSIEKLALNSNFEDRVVDNIHYINGSFDTSQTSSLLSRVIDVLSQISTESKYTVFDVIISGAGRYNLNGYLYADRTYGSGYLFSFDNVYRWVRNNGTDSLEEVALNSKIFTYEIGSVTTDSAGLFTLSNYTTPWNYVVIGVYRSVGGNSTYCFIPAGHTSNANMVKVVNRGDMSAAANTTISNVTLIMLKL